MVPDGAYITSRIAPRLSQAGRSLRRARCRFSRRSLGSQLCCWSARGVSNSARHACFLRVGFLPALLAQAPRSRVPCPLKKCARSTPPLQNNFVVKLQTAEGKYIISLSETATLALVLPPLPTDELEARSTTLTLCCLLLPQHVATAARRKPVPSLHGARACSRAAKARRESSSMQWQCNSVLGTIAGNRVHACGRD